MAKAAMVPGIGQKLSKLEVAMNRAAEAAAALATTIFATAIGNMTFTDAKAILNGESSSTLLVRRVKTFSGCFYRLSKADSGPWGSVPC